MTACNICYEELVVKGDKDDIDDYLLDIDIALKCETPNCKSIICSGCESKMQDKLGVNLKQIIKCPLCRQPYYKNHLKWNVLEIDLKNKIARKKKKLEYIITFNEELIEYNKELINNLQREIDQCKEKLSVYEN